MVLTNILGGGSPADCFISFHVLMTYSVSQDPEQSPSPGPKGRPAVSQVNVAVITLSLHDFDYYTRVLSLLQIL